MDFKLKQYWFEFETDAFLLLLSLKQAFCLLKSIEQQDSVKFYTKMH